MDLGKLFVFHAASHIGENLALYESVINGVSVLSIADTYSILLHLF